MTDTAQLLAERHKTHGEYINTARVQQALKTAMRASPNWDTLPDIYKESLEMCAHKIGRILSGNAFTLDHQRDIIGYITLLLDRTEDGVGLKQPQASEPPEEPPLGKTFDLMQSRMTESRHVDGGFKVGDIEPPVVPRREPTYYKPGTPEDGGHHARQDFDERETLHITAADKGKFFKTRGGEFVQVVEVGTISNFPVVVDRGTWPKDRRRTARGRVHWQLGAHADEPSDLVERLEVLPSGVA